MIRKDQSLKNVRSLSQMNLTLKRFLLTFGAILSIAILFIFLGFVFLLFLLPLNSDFGIEYINGTFGGENLLIEEVGSVELFEIAKRRAELMVKRQNDNPFSTWKAKLNPDAIGVKDASFIEKLAENKTLFSYYDRHQEVEKIIFGKFYPFYEQHLNSLYRNRHRKIPDEFSAAKRWPDCAENILRERNQGGCGSCWAVAAASVISDRICIAQRKMARRMKVNLSAQEIIECCEYCGGCTGAPNSFVPFVYWLENGLVSENCYPYKIRTDCGFPCKAELYNDSKGLGHCVKNISCPNRRIATRNYAKYAYKIGSLDGTEPFSFPLSLHTFMKNSSLGKKNPADAEQLIKRDLMEHGPIMLCFSVFEGFLHYFDGVYNFILQPNEFHVYDHCSKVIGWGINNSTGHHQRYLLAINSWSSKWARDGTFKLDIEQIKNFNSDFFGGIPDIFRHN